MQVSKILQQHEEYQETHQLKIEEEMAAKKAALKKRMEERRVARRSELSEKHAEQMEEQLSAEQEKKGLIAEMDSGGNSPKAADALRMSLGPEEMGATVDLEEAARKALEEKLAAIKAIN